MIDPFSLALHIQQAAVKNFCTGVELFTNNYLHLLEQQQHLFEITQAPKRSEDAGRHPKTHPCGPDLGDHYGRRAHDVDVEKI
jgi:hypothetical protein